MKKLFYLSLVSILMCSCWDDMVEATLTSGVSYTSNPDVTITAKRISPLQVECHADYKDVSKLVWYFGDDTMEDGNYANIYHHYNQHGKYKITCKAYNSKGEYVCQHSVAIDLTTPPTAIHVAGFELTKIPYENRYYRIHMYDDDWFATNWEISLPYSPLLKFSDIPYTFEHNKIMDKLDGDNYYNIVVYCSADKNKTGTEVLRTKLYKSDILAYYAATRFEENNIILRVLWEYDYE